MPPESLSDDARRRLATLMSESEHDYQHFIGFPAALDCDYSELAPFTNRLFNNVGDPLVPASHGLQTKQFEREVIDFCAELFRAPADDYWGYVTNGSSECNLYALYLAREKLPGAVVYHSAAAHYSIPKNSYLLGMPAEQVRTDDHGEMEYAHLEQLLAAHPDTPAIVVATIGTTMTEARDNVATIKRLLQTAGVPHHIHADAALAGIYAALLSPHQPFDFADGADSINISGHKFLGCPMPCGVVLARRSDKERLRAVLSYTGSPDTTITGSRNGHTPLYLWYAIERYGRDGLRRRATQAQHTAAYALTQLRAIGWEAWRNPHALTVVLKTPPAAICHTWQLASYEGWSHIICMPGVSHAQIDAFVADLQATLPDAATQTIQGAGTVSMDAVS